MAKQSRCRRVARSTPEPPVAAVPATPEPPSAAGLTRWRAWSPSRTWIRHSITYDAPSPIRTNCWLTSRRSCSSWFRRRPGKMRRIPEKWRAALRHAIFLLCFSASRFIMLQRVLCKSSHPVFPKKPPRHRRGCKERFEYGKENPPETAQLEQTAASRGLCGRRTVCRLLLSLPSP